MPKSSLRKFAEHSRTEGLLPFAITLFFFVLLIVITNFPSNAWMSGITKNYLPIHILLEFAGILVSFAVFTVGWATYQNARSTDILILSVASFAVGWLDLGHTLSFTGMPDFVGPSGPNKAIDFWLASRFTGSMCFLFTAFSSPREMRFPWLQRTSFLMATTWVILAYWLILFQPQTLPVMFIQGRGLMPLKILLEWIVVGISSVAGAMYFRRAETSENLSFRWMGSATLLYAMSGYFFTIYQDFDDLYNFAGHVYKAVAFLLVYRAVFVECISKPYEHMRSLAIEASSANAAKSRFLANVSHEFRTPLGVITGFSDLMLNSQELSGKTLEWTRTIARNARQLGLLIDDLLSLAKAENEKISTLWSRFDVVAILRDVVGEFQPQAHNKGVTLELTAAIFNDPTDRSSMVTSDELRLRQILMNMIGNAVKFTSQGQVSVGFERLSAQEIKITVADTGLGITPADALRLFQPFSQVANPTSRRFAGTGLGLALSKRLAALLGGDLVLENSMIDRGSCFAVTFRDQTPSVSATEIKPKTTSPLRNQAPLLNGRKILIAEDSSDNRMLLSHYLKPTGAEITFAVDGVEAVEFAHKSPYDIILMDIQMPRLDGFEATVKLREQGWRGPIVALTAHALQPERERALQSGFDDYLVKPIVKETLWNAIAQRVETKLNS